MPLAGGILQHGYQCGMIWGATLAAGAEAYRLYGPGPKAEVKAISAAQKMVESFRAYSNNINCLEIIGLDKSSTGMQMFIHFVLKGGTIGCIRRAAKYSKLAFNDINTALSENQAQELSPPISCAAVLAQKMGVSDKHTVMASGFAGGIGLCGGACGALGAAIWIISMNIIREQDGKLSFNNPKAQSVIEGFLKLSDHEFECSKIVGRKFESINDHAEYLHDGGCANLINSLATLNM